jgi:hypothetical protein
MCRFRMSSGTRRCAEILDNNLKMCYNLRGRSGDAPWPAVSNHAKFTQHDAPQCGSIKGTTLLDGLAKKAG